MTQRKEQKQIPCVCDKHYIKEQLQGMGVRKGMVLLVQGKMEKLGKIIGGAQTLIDAIMEVIGYEGTLVMPAFTPYKKDPACLWDGKEYREQWEQIRKGERPFDRKLDAPRNTLAAQFMRNEGVLRSHHPLYSFLAWGKYAKVIVEKHPLHFGLNEESPLGKLCEFLCRISNGKPCVRSAGAFGERTDCQRRGNSVSGAVGYPLSKRRVSGSRHGHGGSQNR